MSSRPRILLFEALHIVHKGLPLVEGGRVFGRLVFVFEMRFVLSRSREFRNLLGDQVIDFLPA